MTYTKEDLIKTLIDLYPEIDEYELNLDLEKKDSDNEWIVTISKGEHKLSTYLSDEDADACMAGSKCVYLEVQIDQYIKKFKLQ